MTDGYCGREGMLKKIFGGVTVQRVGALVIGIAVLAYSVYHVVSLFGEDIATISTGVSTEARVIDGKGYIFRDETVIYSSGEGIANYLKSDGSKVSKDEPLAEVGTKGTRSAQSLVKYYDEKIEILQKSVDSGKSLSDLPEINDDIADTYYSIAKLLATGDTGAIDSATDKLLTLMNTKSLLTDEKSPVDDVLEDMKERRSAIIESGGEKITEYATESGYFYSYADGYEQYFTVEAADSLTSESYYALTTEKTPYKTDTAIGKLAKSNEWRFVVRLPATTAASFSEGEEYDVEFVENGRAGHVRDLFPRKEHGRRGQDVAGG